MKELFTLMFAAIISTGIASVHADDMMTSAAGSETQPAAEVSQPKPEKKMKMNEPMPTGMARQGMMKGDVKKAAEKKAKEMKPMMEQEEKAMPQSPLQQ